MGGSAIKRSLSTLSGYGRAVGRAACVAAIIAALPATALADGRSAVQNLFANAATARLAPSFDQKTTQATPSLVRGMYVLTTSKGEFAGFVNEAGTLWGDVNEMRVYSPSGAQPRPITPQERDALRAEMMSAIEYDKLIKVTYGDGGGRKMLMFSALDCGYCKMFEQQFSKVGPNNNTAFYVVPSSLRPIKAGGEQAWQGVTQIWCAPDNGQAWKNFWATNELPAPRQCGIDAAKAERDVHYLSSLMKVAGVKVTGTPQLVREDGVMIHPGDFKAYLKLRSPVQSEPKLVWLAAADPTVQAATPSNNKINVGEKLKKLFN